MADRRKYQNEEGYVKRRSRPDRRKGKRSHPEGRIPGWDEQRLQYITRLVLFMTGVIYFNFIFEYNSPWMSLRQFNLFLFLYCLFVIITLFSARRKLYSPIRFRLTMWVDILSVSIGVLNDPFVVPLVSLVYIIIVLGNGMRYNMRIFTEALAGSVIAALTALTVRYYGSFTTITPGVIFLYIFAIMIIVYSYVLMHRIDNRHRELHQSSRCDYLTGLLNRSALIESAKTFFSGLQTGGEKMIVMFADMDRFKEVNDTMGHAVGDRVLMEVAGIIKRSVRDDDIAARYGGDEFVLIIRESGMEEASHISRRIQDAVRHWGEENGINISVSIGIGEAPRHGNSLDVILDLVDEALYSSKKEQGPGGICYADAARH
jgi:diguanylate cyclase (GGDEF)-like protein